MSALRQTYHHYLGPGEPKSIPLLLINIMLTMLHIPEQMCFLQIMNKYSQVAKQYSCRGVL